MFALADAGRRKMGVKLIRASYGEDRVSAWT